MEHKLYITKKSLKQQILDLKQELEYEKALNRISENSGLSKCTGIVCKSCDHAVYIADIYGVKHLVGCDVTVNCANYSKRATKELFPNDLR